MSEEGVDPDCGGTRGSINHSERECHSDVGKNIEKRHSKVEICEASACSENGDVDSRNLVSDLAALKSDATKDNKYDEEELRSKDEQSTNAPSLDTNSVMEENAESSSTSERGARDKNSVDTNKLFVHSKGDASAEMAAPQADGSHEEDMNPSENGSSNMALTDGCMENNMETSKSNEETVITDTKSSTPQEESIQNSSAGRRSSRRCSQSSLSSETGSTGSASGEWRLSKRTSRQLPNSAINPQEKRKCRSSQDSASGQSEGLKQEENRSTIEERVTKSKRQYHRRKTSASTSANSTAEEDSDFEDSLTLASLRNQARSAAAGEFDAQAEKKESPAVVTSEEVTEKVGRKSQKDRQSNSTSVARRHGDESSTLNDGNEAEEGKQQDVVGKFQASQQATVISSPQKRMEQLLGQNENNKLSMPKARKSVPLSSEKKPMKKMPRAKMSLSPNRLSSVTIDNFFKPVDGKVRGRPKAKKSLSHGSKYRTSKGQLSPCASDMKEAGDEAQLSRMGTMISSAAATQALSALTTGNRETPDEQSLPPLGSSTADVENSVASNQKSCQVKTSKMPKARKSFPQSREPLPLSSTDQKSSYKQNAATETSQGHSDSFPNTHMTFKIQDLENVFGLKNNLNKLDAKTLDKLVLECALKSKDRSESKKDAQSAGKLDDESGDLNTTVRSHLNSSSCRDHAPDQLAQQEEEPDFASILISQKILRKRKKRRRSRMGTYNLPACNKKHKAKKARQQQTSTHQKLVQQSNESAPVLEKSNSAGSDSVTLETSNEDCMPSEADVSKSAEEGAATTSLVKKQRKRHYRKRLRYEPKKKIPKYIRARLRDLQKRIHMQCATPEQEEMYYQLESASRLNMPHLIPSIISRKRKRKIKADDDTGSVISTSTSVTESESSAHSKDVTIQKRRRTDDAIPLLSPITDIPVINHSCHVNSLPPKISPQKVTGISMLKPLSGKGKLGLTKLSPGLECLDAVPGAKKHHIEGASCADTHRDQGLPYKFHNTPNGITYPVTPPHTPEHGVTPPDAARSENEENHEIQGSDHRSEYIPVCCCKLPGTIISNALPGHRTSLYCQALDSVNGKIIGCCNKVTNGQMVRPAHKIPFMVLCEAHRERLKMHQCCPGCGQFCTEGKFLQCKSEITKKGLVVLHHFHAQCQTYKASKYFCPHCAHESDQFEVTLKYSGSRSSWATVDVLPPGDKHVRSDGSKSARMGVLSPTMLHSEPDGSTGIEITASHTNKTISSKKLPLGPSRSELENAMSVLDSDRAKKLRQGSKNLYKASKTGDVEKVIVMLADGANPNLRYEDDHNQSPLHAAAAMGHYLIVHLLLQAGANPHAIDNSLSTPLILAAEKGNMQILQILVKSGGLVDARRSDGMTSLHLAAQSGKVDAVRFLLETRKISVNVKDDGGWTPLIWAAEHSHLDVVHYLLDNGADPNIRDNEGNTALHWAAFSGSTDIAEIFLNAGCDLETVNEIGDRPLHIAARQDHYECVVLFLARGADSEARNNDNEAPIGCCIEQNTPTWMALRVNRQLQGFATRKLQQHERLLHRDISYGRDTTPMPVVNMVDDENYPTDFLYVTDCIETTPMNVNRLITSLAACRCKENCGSVFCECSHNSVKCWYEKDGKLVKDFNYSDPPLIFECNKACRCWSSCQNRVVQLGISCRLQVFRTEGRGWGVRTLLDIPQGTFVCEYIGELISDAEADSREDDSYLFDLDNKDTDTYCIDARHYGNISRFINHLCQPNLIPIKVFVDHQDLRFPRICFFASRDVKAYEELGFDYGEKFWIIKWKQFTCTCGSAKCRYSKETIHKTLEDYNRRQGDDEPVVEQA